MVGNRGTFTTLLGYLESAIDSFPDHRTGKNCVYSIRDAALSAFSVFFMQCPSFLAHQKLMRSETGDDNAHTIFGVEKIPSDNCIRYLIDPVSPQALFPVYQQVHAQLAEDNRFEREYRSVMNTYLMAVDGVWFHNSEEVHCGSCSRKHHRDGRTTWYHSALTPAFVRAGSNTVIAVEPEFITPQDGAKKQDCEINAGKRWVAGVGKKYAAMGVTLLCDDLYARQPFFEHALGEGFHLLCTCKSSSHRYLYDWVSAASEDIEAAAIVWKRWTGKERLYERYRFMNDVPLRDGDDALRVNWCELVITDQSGKERKRFAFVTDHHITHETVISLVAAGRARWKIENEHNNTLKTKGYNLEHNFGHGEKHLANTLVMMNLLAFLFHTMLDLYDRRYQVLRHAVGRRDAFFNDIRALTRYMCFDSWNALLLFMLKGLKIPDPAG